MKVILAEKPSVARDIARVIGANLKREGYLEGNSYQVTWAFGHLVEIAEPSVMSSVWGGKWNFAQLPMIPEQFQLTPVKNSKKQFDIICRLFNESEEIINATDAGREGELIFRWIYNYSNCRKPFKRLWISDLTDESIREGLNALSEGKDFDSLGFSAQCRAFADWMVGLNATRAYSIRHNQLFTVGRVQTPTLALIVNRQKLIQGFEKFYYYELHALASNVLFRWMNEEGYKIEDKNTALQLQAKVEGKKAFVKSIKKTKRKIAPPSLYDLTLLQKECNEKFGFTAQKTLECAQALYEKHKLITYPRTESRHLSEKMRGELPKILANAPDELQYFAKEALLRLEGGFKLSKNYIDDKKLTDHHAIIPTKKKNTEYLDGDLKSIYELIQKRFIAIFLEDFAEDFHEVILEIENELFKFQGAEPKSIGWRRMYIKDFIETQDPLAQYPKRADVQEMLNVNFKKGKEVVINELKVEEKETAPPKPYTDGTLLNAMRYIGKQVDDSELAAQLKDQGLGTQATRASIIERLIRSKYIYRKSKNILPTDKGVGLIDVVMEDLKSPELTAQWEIKLSEIQDGKISHHQFMKEIEDFTREVIKEIQIDQTSIGKENFGNCPQCQKGTIYEGSKSFYCSRYRDNCDFTIWGKIASRRMQASEIKQLIKDRHTPLIDGFMSKTGKPFSAVIELDQNFKTKFKFK